MDVDRSEDREEHRWVLLLHMLFATTLAIPSVLSVIEGTSGVVGTLALAAVLAVAYVLLYVPNLGGEGDRRLLLLYVVAAVPVYAALQLREGVFVLLLYALMPQLFAALPRWQAIAAVAALTLAPSAASRDFDLGDLYNLVGVVALGLLISLIIETLADRNDRQREMIAELEAAHAENARLAEEAAVQGRAAGVLAERQRLAHEIHDTLAQGFTSVVTQLEAAEQALGGDLSVAADHVARAKRTARAGLTEARRTVEALRPAPLDGADLPRALRTFTGAWQQEHGTGVAIEVVVDGDAVDVDDTVEDAVLRVAQEALTNVAHHADATRVTVTLSYLDDLLLLDVQDDGRGFGGGARGPGGRTGFGLVSMRERIALVGGDLTIESVPGEGTTVAARAPLVRPGVSDDLPSESESESESDEAGAGTADVGPAHERPSEVGADGR